MQSPLNLEYLINQRSELFLFSSMHITLLARGQFHKQNTFFWVKLDSYHCAGLLSPEAIKSNVMSEKNALNKQCVHLDCWFYHTALLKLFAVSVLFPAWSGTGLRLITPLSSRAPVLLPRCIQSCLSLQNTTQPPFSFTPTFPGPSCSVWCTGLLKYSELTLPSYYLRIQLYMEAVGFPAMQL